MPGQPKRQDVAIKRAGLAVAGSGGVSGLGTLFFTAAHGSSPLIALIVAVVTALVVLLTSLPSIIDAIGNKCVAVINAKADAHVAMERSRQRTDLMNAGLAGGPEAALSLLRLQPFDAKVVVDPQCGDDIRRLLLPEQRPEQPSRAPHRVKAEPSGPGEFRAVNQLRV